MRGNDLLEAMSFVDEKYIAEADAVRGQKKNRWVPVLAMAACLSLVLLGLRSWIPAMHKEAVQEAAVEEIYMDRAMTGELASANSVFKSMEAAAVFDTTASVSFLTEVTVRVTAVEETSFTAVIAAPGPMEEGTEVTVLLPETEEPLTVQVDDLLDVIYIPNPEQDTILEAQEIRPAGENSD